MEDAPALQAKVTKRKLKRLHSQEKAPIVVEEALCIHGGWLKEPLYLPTVLVHGCKMVPITCVASGWFCQIVVGGARSNGSKVTPLGSVLRLAVQECKDAASKMAGAVEESAVERALAARAALRDDDDDAGDVLHDMSDGNDEEPQHAANRRGRRSKDSKSPLDNPCGVQVKDWSFVCAELNGKFHVQATTQDLAAFVGLVHSYTAGDVEEIAPKKDPEEHADDEKGCVLWDFGKKTWQVRYRDAEGKAHSYTRDLKVNPRGVDGTVLEEEKYVELRNSVKRQAMSKWNELDKSSRPRFSLV